MAVVLASSDYRNHSSLFLGLSTDVKNTLGLVAGARFIELDTGKEFVYNGIAWFLLAGAVQLTGSYAQVDVVIADEDTVSTEIDFRNYKYLSFLMPAAWDVATLTIYGSATAGGTKVVITNDVGVVFPAMTVAVDKIYSVDVHALKLAGVHFLALVASAAQTGGPRTIKVMLKA